MGRPATTGIDQYELKSFIADFTHFKPGDTVPQMYRTDEYNIKQWKLRNLPAPNAGTHWTYMGGAYVLINDTDGKIIKAYDGEIFIIDNDIRTLCIKSAYSIKLIIRYHD